MTANPFAPPAATVADVEQSSAEETPTPFFAVSTNKLLVMSICTLGLYQVYWFYKHWQHIRRREQSRLSPAPRALFSILFCYPCFRRIRNFDAPGLGKTKLAAGPLAAGWIITTLLQLPDPYWLVSLFAPAFLVPVQALANRKNAAVSPDHDPNDRFSVGNWIFIAFGSVLLAAAVFETMALRLR
ncbi:MAG TPA: DUF4234 domain-containing protein [Rhodocyclaceae bacterium]|nr:DUF4234 domain-containing protein [Rhodocyclaceae bacterium]